ncbi:MAG TPA: site-2 protease family protein [Pyrinomonadaceae bacterium]|nr:site-2 protease family protein [Pyrinomonadaceae bacterium]
MFLFTISVAVSFVVAMILHEIGHWGAARALNVRVLQAGVGWGPKIVGVTIWGVDCQLRALPLGAFTRIDMAGLQRRPLAQQLLVLGAGIGINLLLGLVAWGTTFGFINLALAVGNLLPLYQLDGWKGGMVICRQIFGGRNPHAEWTFTILGGLLVTALVVQGLFV